MIHVHTLPDQQIQCVIRRIHNTICPFRKVGRYGADYVVMGQADIRARLICTLQQTMQNYSN